MRPRFTAAITGRLVAAAVLFAVASCAPLPSAPVSGAPGVAVGAATVLTVRPIAAAENLGGWRAALLNGAGESSRPVPAGTLAEFIVRVDDGATLSIVQPNDAGLRVGERVVLARPSALTGSPRLARPL